MSNNATFGLTRSHETLDLRAYAIQQDALTKEKTEEEKLRDKVFAEAKQVFKKMEQSGKYFKKDEPTVKKT